MTNLVADILLSNLPARRTGSGWHKFNAICCQHNGQSKDQRQRGGIKQDGDTVVYNCFNCGFAAGYTTGNHITGKMKKLLGWAGVSEDALKRLIFDVGLLKHQREHGQRVVLPEGLKTVLAWLLEGTKESQLLQIADFLTSDDRMLDLASYFWTPDPNDMDLDRYVVTIKGDLEYPTGWWAYPVLDSSLPVLTQSGPDDEPEDDEPRAEDIEEFRRILIAEGAIGE
ncbi:hypothetical protein [Sphingobium sp. LSP13-1-1.1]|uniref:hypothetical protein n=1 Tax=Sphingobium sp. LSP13-1-1.1 TaxID=3135234 RepID=UPI003440BD24